jgi:hypothetical protein
LVISVTLPAQRRGNSVPLAAPYLISNDSFHFKYNSSSPIPVDATGIHFIDNRYDNSKLGYVPVLKDLPKQLVPEKALANWLEENTEPLFSFTGGSSRRLEVVIQHLWISTRADNRFTIFKQNLLSALEYKIEIFSETAGQFYPCKRVSGSFETALDRRKGYDQLFDSLFNTLKKELSATDFSEREKRSKPLDKNGYHNYLSNKFNDIPSFRNLKKGMYNSYGDFLSQKTTGDSVVILKNYHFDEKNPPAAHVGIYSEGKINTSTKSWGYFNGEYLYYNTGNGFFVKLWPWQGQYILCDLQRAVMPSINRSVTIDARIGQSDFDIIRDYAKLYILFFQVDFGNGRLY